MRRVAGLAVAGVLLVALGWAAVRSTPRALRRAEVFQVARVEVTGNVLLPAADAIAALRLPADASILDDTGPFRDSLLRHPMVVDARIERRPLSTLVVHVTEAVPVAFVATPALRPVSAAGELLPIDPAATGLDLPVLVGNVEIADGRVADPGALAAIADLDRVRTLAPELFSRISDGEPLPGGGLRVRLRSPAGLVALLPAAPAGPELERLGLALADIVGRGETGSVRVVDARFRDQVVVSLSPDARR